RRARHPFPTRRSSDLDHVRVQVAHETSRAAAARSGALPVELGHEVLLVDVGGCTWVKDGREEAVACAGRASRAAATRTPSARTRSEEHTSELQSRENL